MTKSTNKAKSTNKYADVVRIKTPQNIVNLL